MTTARRLELGRGSRNVAIQELQAWQLRPDEFLAAMERVKADFEIVISQALAIWPQRPHTKEVAIHLPMPRNRAESAGDSAFREILETILPNIKWEVYDG